MNRSCTLVLCAALTLSAGAHGRLAGDPAPVCDLTAFGESQRVDMRELRGEVLYVDFWASWCRPCAKAFPFMNALEREFGERGLRIIAINLDEDVKSAKDFLSKHPAQFTLAADASGRCPKDFGVQAMPSSYLVDRQGIIRYVHVGFRAGETDGLRKAVEQLLSE